MARDHGVLVARLPDNLRLALTARLGGGDPSFGKIVSKTFRKVLHDGVRDVDGGIVLEIESVLESEYEKVGGGGASG